MPDHLKDLFDRALDDEPSLPDGDFARQVMAQGRGIRRRRHGLLAGGAMAAAAVAVVAALGLTPAPTGPPPWIPEALALVAQTEPQCTWPASDNATDVWISLRPDSSEQQHDALRDALHADPLVRNVRFDSREVVYERLKQLWSDSPDFVAAIDPSSVTDSFRLKLTGPAEYSKIVAGYAGRPGVAYVAGGVCP
ncbi:permease-like cell division protein FtsX [Actinoplanes sp. NPDC023801]|uniref:permease-like cell division protein FtsX n=1 Tax=Actinoplanes sp. NPDC023801 TaxID=3154595 RepID=UPI0033E81E58